MKKLIRNSVIILLCIAVPVAAFLLIRLDDAIPSSQKATVVGELDSIKGESYLTFDDSNEAYAMGVNAEGMPVFKDLNRAFKQMKKDYAPVIEKLKKDYKLKPLTHFNWRIYKVYGWQIQTEDPELLHQCYRFICFFDIYENSFENIILYWIKTAWTRSSLVFRRFLFNYILFLKQPIDLQNAFLFQQKLQVYAKKIIGQWSVNAAAHSDGEAFGNGEAKAGGFAASGGVGGVETVKDVRKIVGGDAVGRVFKGDVHCFIQPFGSYGKTALAVGQGIA